MWRFNLAISELFCDKIGPGQLHPSEIWQPLSGTLKLKLSFLETYDKILIVYDIPNIFLIF